MKFCACGRWLINGICPRCKDKTVEWGKKETKEKRGKYSGKSKTPYGAYEER